MENIPVLEGRSILIAEDEEINYLYIKTLVQKTGAKVIHAWNGQQAIDLVSEHKNLDLVLMDIKMPIINGYIATEKIKKLRPTLPVVAQTAYAMGDDKVRCFEAGCDDYISKPIRKNNLFSILSKILVQ